MEKTVKLTSKERDEIILSLSVRCGFIETGTMHRAKDLQNAGQKDQIKVLTTDSMRMIIFLEDLMAKI